MLPPPRPVCTEEEHSSALLEVRGLGEADVDTIAGQGVWVNNFSLVAAFVALGYTPLLISPLSGTCITPGLIWERWDRSDDTVLLGPELTARQPGLRDMFGSPFGSGTFWGAGDVRRRVASGDWGEGGFGDISSCFLQDLQSKVKKEQMVKCYDGVKPAKSL